MKNFTFPLKYCILAINILFCLNALSQTQTFTSNGSFVVPAGVTSVNVSAWGAGGGGADEDAGWGGGGGGGGGFSGGIITVSPGNTLTITIGNGGIGATSDSSDGADGGNTIVSHASGIITAFGGLGGESVSTLGGTGGGGSFSGIITSQVTYSGGNGGNGDNDEGGAGGGAGGDSGNGSNGANAAGNFAPPGGAGGTNNGNFGTGNGGNGGNDNSGDDGSDYGGGGGASGDGNGIGGTGANGLVILSYTVSLPEINIQGAGNNILHDAPLTNTPTVSNDTDFGNIDVAAGSNSNQFTIQNTGSATLNLTGSPLVTITGTHAGDFTVTAMPSASIAASGFTTFTILFDPNNVGLRTASVSIANNDSDEDPYTFNIQGNGTSTLQEINITGLGNSILNGDLIPTSIDNTDFANVVSGSGTKTNAFTIENHGTVNTLNLTGATPYVVITGTNAADFNVTTIPSNSITAGNTTSFAITFSPSTDGLKTATVTIVNDDSDEGSYSFTIQGTGFTPPPCGVTILHSADFESGLDGWTVGGTDATRVNNATASFLNNYSLEIRSLDASGNNSSVLSPLFDLNQYDKIDIEFFFTAYNVENTENFFIEYSNDSGSSWTVVSDYLCGDVVNKNADYESENAYTFYGKTSTLLNINYSFPSGTVSQFRIRSDASDATDLVYIDNITISGTIFCTPTTAPGGVTNNLDLWLRADKLDGVSVGTDGTEVSQWIDKGKGNHAETRVTGQEPVYRNNTSRNINFNPVIDFENDNNTANQDMTYIINDGSRDELFSTSGFNSNDIFLVLVPDPAITTTMIPLDTFTSTNPNGNTQSEDVTGFGYGNYTSRMNNELLSYCIGTTSGLNNGYGRGSTNATQNYNKISIVNMRHNASDTGEEIYLNANQIGDVTSDAPLFSGVNNTRYWLGRSQYWNGSFDGRIAEVITYSATNNDTDDTTARNRIQSYLGIKYGITLAPYSGPITADIGATTKDYVNSDGVVIWDHIANNGFNHDVAGIGRDDASELNQKQSQSINDATDGIGRIEGIITVGLTAIYDTNSSNIASNPTNFNDKEFLIWGDNNINLNDAAATVTVDMSSGIGDPTLETQVEFTAMERIWKFVEVGGNIPSVKISIPQNAIRNITPPGSYLMFISDTPLFDPTADYRVMTVNGSNLETDYDFDGTKYITFGYAPQVVVDRCIKFDGVVDYIDIGNHLNLNPTEFSLSAWILRESGSENSSIISKRDALYTEGYDFKINSNGRLEMILNGGTEVVTSTHIVPTDEWHHVAAIYSGGTATLYIDGIPNGNAALAAPVSTTQSCYIAAAGKISPTAYFKGSIDEVRVWDKALSVDQLRYIMNQEIEDNGGAVNGTTLPLTISKNEVASIPWTDLAGYYPMSIYTYTNTNDASGNKHQGALRNLDTVDKETAPLPYVSQGDGAWTTDATWLNNSVQALPNAVGIDGTTLVDWNIVQIGHNITIDTFTNLGRERSVQGLIVNTGNLEINGDTASNTGNGLTVTHYLKLDGTIDLEGESQLIQTQGSDLDPTSSGSVQRDQQGTSNTYIYNYWSSPVGQINALTNNNDYTLPDVVSGVSFLTSGYNGTSAPAVADYWIWKYANNTANTYSEWEHVRSTGSILPGEGFTMKGPNTTNPNQNYVLTGKPYNGDITLPLAPGNDYLVGNPYASALDANLFILDNISVNDGGTNPNTTGNVINGALYFWDHFSDNTHVLAEYQGGYATYTLIGGTQAISNDARINATGAVGTKIPERYIPVGQGFFVSSILDPSLADDGITLPVVGGDILFKNSQRIFKKETVSGSNTGSVFVKNGSKNKSKNNAPNTDARSRIRLMFDSPDGYHRELLVGTDAKATEGFDLGYDAPIAESNKEDMYWQFENTNFIIQAVDNFNPEKVLPLGVKINKEGMTTIRITALENLEDNFKIYLHDKALNIYQDLRAYNYDVFLNAGEFNDRFEITFSEELSLSSETQDYLGLEAYYSNEKESIVIHNKELQNIKSVELLNILGQSLFKSNIDTTKDYIAYKLNQIKTGAYIISIKTNTGEVSKKVLID